MSKSRFIGLIAGLSVLAGCGDPAGAPEAAEGTDFSQGLTWQEFMSKVYQEPDTGVYIANGDEPYYDEDELWQLYLAVRGGGGALIVYNKGGTDIKWTASQALNLTYCVSTKFGAHYDQVVKSMNTAAGAWEGAARVNFIHVSSQDSNCTSRNTNVVFDVNPVDVNGQYLARAFFPNASRSSRNILIDWSSFEPTAPGLDGILRHELGHTLGFRHEHTRPEARACYEDSLWRALTPYDSSSVMHYPQCNGTNSWALTLTNLDKQGAAKLYP